MLLTNHWTHSIREIVGAEAALPPGTSPWKQITPALVVYPRTASEVARVLRFAAEEGLGVIPRGRGTKVGWGEAPTRADIVLSLESLAGLVAHEPGDMTVTTEAGMGISDLQAEVTATGARLDLDPPFIGAATLGGVIASQSTGPVHVRISDLILGMEIALPDGSLVRTGSRVVKSVAGFDLHKALVGSRGTLGVITEMTWRLRPSPPASRYLTAEVARGEAADRLAALRQSEVRPAWTLLENGRWEGFPPRRVGEESVLVHLVCEGEAEAVDAHLEKASEILGAGGNGASGRAGRESDILRMAIRNFPHHHLDWFPCRIGVLPASVLDLFGEASEFSLIAHLESGLVHAGVPRADIAAGSPGEGVDRLRRVAEGMGGYLTVEAPAEDGIDVWGRRRDDFFLMEALKKEFDPKATLFPGHLFGNT